MLWARPALSTDAEFLWSMLFYAADIDGRPAAAAESIRNRYLHNWGRLGDLGVIASDAQRPIGAAWLRLPTDDDTHSVAVVARDVPELAIAVEPDRIGQGVGSFLLDRLLGQADRDGISAIVLSTRADNPAIRLYGRFGFVESGRIANSVGDSSVKMIRRSRRPRRRRGPSRRHELRRTGTTHRIETAPGFPQLTFRRRTPDHTRRYLAQTARIGTSVLGKALGNVHRHGDGSAGPDRADNCDETTE